MRKRTCCHCFRMHFKLAFCYFLHSFLQNSTVYQRVCFYIIFVCQVVNGCVPVYDSTYIFAIPFCFKENKSPRLSWMSYKIKDKKFSPKLKTNNRKQSLVSIFYETFGVKHCALYYNHADVYWFTNI